MLVASRCTSYVSNARIALKRGSRRATPRIRSPECRWLVGHSRTVRGEYTRRAPIDNLKGTGDDFEYGRRVPDELAVRLDPDRLLAVDLDPARVAKFDLGQLAVRPSVQHRQAADT